ncbi:M48 family metallopeptidase [Psychrobacter sp. FDAARGOS_221]|uniref:M48 family metallopeptidase n=1 Tax=Psychrobacter sp. FDAARGOS_221 TaxID=1975705 RepID=UPI000BB54C1D|nr:SprT family zinc-dependent metalloprotease [Psychrobacter sp. FDAARGOS_221]PNK59496.1 M48 family peptidase [Psychrobacter sp. FDAARGOS_221]
MNTDRNHQARILYYGEHQIAYTLVHKDNARKLRIKVHPDERVEVIVPPNTTDDFVESSVKKRARWIWQHLQDFKSQTNRVLPRRYVSGEPQFYLGRRYVLKVVVDPDEAPNVKLVRGKLTVTLSEAIDDADKRGKQVKSLLNNWYQQKAKTIFAERLTLALFQAHWVSASPSFKLLTMRKQWGSCSAQGNLVLNPHLVKAPKECIDYVILHELCHIAEHNHSERFWRLLTQVMPHWKQVKTELDGMAEFYLNE